MISRKSVANAVGGKTARACDSCIKKRARWYCAADDAFLCQACDSSVHSANPLARRHERVLLKTASLKTLDLGGSKENSVPTWHRGFTRKARTPRHGKPGGAPQSKTEDRIRNPIPLVPEVGSDDVSHEDDEEQHLLYRVPVFDPSVAELCTTSTTISNEAGGSTIHSSYGGDGTDRTAVDGNRIESKPSTLLDGGGQGQDVESLQGNFLPSDMDLAEFAADVESLLGKGLENESFGMEELGLVDCDNKEEKKFQMKQCVKVEEELGEEAVGLESHGDTEIDMGRDPPFELTFDYDSPATCGEDLKDSSGEREDDDEDGEQKKKKKRKILLTLNYEAVMTAWASQGSSPWTNGCRPDFDPDECWPDCMGSCGTQFHPYADMSGVGGHHAMMDGGREARVSRYREKRRTRLFSKKIRYEVRKLNAEKRPRMKGRFVKRANFTGQAAALLQSAN